MSQDREEKIKKEPKPNDKKIQCDVCGATITYYNRARHERSKKHQDCYYIQFVKFETK